MKNRNIRYETGNTNKFHWFLILLIFTVLIMSALPPVFGEGSGGGSGGDGGDGGGSGGGSDGESGGSGEGPNGGGNQTQEQNGNGTGNSEQNQEENGNGTQNQEQNQEQNGGCNCTGPCNCTGNQEQNHNGTQNQEQNGDCNCSGSCNCTGNHEQNGNGTQNQEQNGGCDCNCSGNGTQNQEQNGGCGGNGSQNREQNGNGTQNQEQNGEGTQNQEQNGEGSQNQEQNQEGPCNCSGEGKMYQYRWYGENGVCVSKHGGEGKGNGSQWRHQYQNQIQNGIENGTLIMETTFQYRERYMLQENNHYSLGMEIELMEVTKNMVRVRVRAEFSEGKVVALNIEENVLKFGNSENVRVRFDGNRIQRGSVEQVMAAEGEQAKYVEAVGEGGSQFLVYIPHFSEHIIEIESLFEEELFTGTNYAVMGISIVALVGLSGHIYKIGKSRM